MADRSPSRRATARLVGVALASLVGLAAARPVAAHKGSVHAGTPHWLLLGVVLAGVAVGAGSFALGRRRWSDRPERTIAGAFAGAVPAVLATIALVEIQVEPLATNPTPVPRPWYPAVAFGVGIAVVLGSVGMGLWRWPERPTYIALGSALGFWVAYPVLVRGGEYFHPFGYALVLSVPALVGYVLYHDVGRVLRGTDRLSRLTGLGTAALFVVFFMFSTGQFTLNPDTGVYDSPEGFVTVTKFANPLVLWPAVEFYFPSIPAFGAVSVGTLVTFGLLGTLVGVNATLATTVWQSDVPLTRSRGILGGVATTGATACCCCAPAVYGIVGAAVGVSASPFYWAFVDPASPVGSIFFVAATGLMTAGAVELAGRIDEAGICRVPA